MSNGNSKPLRESVATGEEGKKIKVFLFEDDQQVAVIIVKSMTEADDIMDRWKDGTYKLLMG